MFWSKNKKNMYTPSKPHFFYIKAGCKGVFITRTCYPDVTGSKVKRVPLERTLAFGYFVPEAITSKVFLLPLVLHAFSVMVLLVNQCHKCF